MAIVKNNPENLKKCSCPNCPTYNECAKEKEELLFCAQEIGKGTCQYKMNGCICPVCPIHKENNLGASFYCIYGSADEIE